MTQQEWKVLNRAIKRLHTGIKKWFKFQGEEYSLSLSKRYLDHGFRKEDWFLLHQYDVTDLTTYIWVCKHDEEITPDKINDALQLHLVQLVQES